VDPVGEFAAPGAGPIGRVALEKQTQDTRRNSKDPAAAAHHFADIEPIRFGEMPIFLALSGNRYSETSLICANSRFCPIDVRAPLFGAFH